MMKVFAYRKCSTCMKALKWLEAHNVEFEERAIKEENPTYEELKEWYTMSGLSTQKILQYQWNVVQADEPEGQTKRNDRR